MEEEEEEEEEDADADADADSGDCCCHYPYDEHWYCSSSLSLLLDRGSSQWPQDLRSKILELHASTSTVDSRQNPILVHEAAHPCT